MWFVMTCFAYHSSVGKTINTDEAVKTFLGLFID